ncbi:conserved hypothetical protein [Vibrio chagasii]|nr:conserved hypothetical protein [Vibrio chagasii]
MRNYLLFTLRLKALDVDGKPQPLIIRLTNAPFVLNYDGYDYQATGDLISIGEYETTYELTTQGVEVTLSGVDPSYLGIMNEQGAFLRAPIDIMIGSVPDGDYIQGANIVQSASYYHRGYADTPRTEFNEETGEVTLSFETQSAFGDLDRSPDLMGCNYANHSSRHVQNKVPDQFFKYSSNVSFGEEVWKK